MWAVRSQESFDMENVCVDVLATDLTWTKFHVGMRNVPSLPGRSTQTLSMPRTCLLHKVQIKKSTKSLF